MSAFPVSVLNFTPTAEGTWQHGVHTGFVHTDFTTPPHRCRGWAVERAAQNAPHRALIFDVRLFNVHGHHARRA
eukprot:5525704-Prymnesium_polylepis.1